LPVPGGPNSSTPCVSDTTAAEAAAGMSGQQEDGV
jgi:hypothetical protein